MDRRTFISLSALVPFFGFGKLVESLSAASSNSILNPKLTLDPKSIMDLHPALKYQVISKELYQNTFVHLLCHSKKSILN